MDITTLNVGELCKQLATGDKESIMLEIPQPLSVRSTTTRHIDGTETVKLVIHCDNGTVKAKITINNNG